MFSGFQFFLAILILWTSAKPKHKDEYFDLTICTQQSSAFGRTHGCEQLNPNAAVAMYRFSETRLEDLDYSIHSKFEVGKRAIFQLSTRAPERVR